MHLFTDEDLILHRYGELEPERAAALQAALQHDHALVARLRDLERVLEAADAAPVPRTPPDIGARTWAGIAGRLPPQVVVTRRDWRLPAALAAGLAVVAIAFQAGRQTVEHPVVPVTSVADTGFSPAARDRVLITQVAHHLEGSRRLLSTVANTPTDAASLEAERKWARDLLATNRLYRKAAVQAGQKRIVSLLDAMEPVLLELANAPDDAGAGARGAIQQRIEEGDLVFRARSAERALDANRVAPLGIQRSDSTAL